eukprot:TRINITY_DN740_c0_g2_i16.p1 TRINITY_DN740_c0_g2~~TRINITY_DN740_c0_g2_i16.p1  ORF type:complete len:146 (+),score=27.43 TRINITY_DN740_c0_g2_i16:210-647(+)
MQKFEQPRNSDISLDKTHLGTLFMIDKSKDGRFYLDEIKQFVDLYFERQAANANTVDVVKEFQGYCTASLWNYVANQKGKETFVKWFGKLFSMGNIAIQGKDSVNIFLACPNTPSLIFYFIPLPFLSYQTKLGTNDFCFCPPSFC